MASDVWEMGDAYEAYVGRWSRPVAERFVPWTGVPAGRRWLDVGCGTGALTAMVLAAAEPGEVVGVDPSAGFLAAARARAAGRHSGFCVGDARALAFADGTFDAVVSGLALNFVPEPAAALAELARVTRCSRSRCPRGSPILMTTGPLSSAARARHRAMSRI